MVCALLFQRLERDALCILLLDCFHSRRLISQFSILLCVSGLVCNLPVKAGSSGGWSTWFFIDLFERLHMVFTAYLCVELPSGAGLRLYQYCCCHCFA